MSAPKAATPGSVRGTISQTPERENQGNPDLDDSAAKDVAQLAYALWERRGYPEGSAEADWFEAEKQLQRKTSI